MRGKVEIATLENSAAIPALRVHRHGAIGDCPCCGYKGAFSATRKDGKELFYCHAGCPQADLLAALHGAPRKEFLPHAHQSRQSKTAPIDYARRLWRESLPATGTLVETYLAARGLALPAPASIRFLPTHAHRPSGSNLPVMLAAVTDHAGHLHAVHRTYLAHDGNGKAPVEPAKMILGAVCGCGCHLAPAGPTLVVAEGIETALSVMQATGLPTWAGLSAGGIRSLILPPLPLAAEVIIAADADPVGMKAAHDAGRRWNEEGRRVRIATPPDGMDFNDVLVMEAAQ